MFETKAGQALTAVDSSLSTASSLLDKNQELLEQLKELNDKIQGHTELGQQISAVIGQKITELENQNASLQELVSSLKTRDSKRSDNSKEYTYFTGKTCERK